MAPLLLSLDYYLVFLTQLSFTSISAFWQQQRAVVAKFFQKVHVQDRWLSLNDQFRSLHLLTIQRLGGPQKSIFASMPEASLS